MTLAHDAYRYVTREYKNPFAVVIGRVEDALK